jgi:hypothetical protein
MAGMSRTSHLVSRSSFPFRARLAGALGVAFATAALGCGGPDSPAPVPSGPTVQEGNRTPPGACLDSYRIDSKASVLEEMRRRGVPAGDFYKSVTAEEVNRDTYVPVAATESYRVDGHPILWFTPDPKRLVVDRAVFSDLTVVDVTRMKAGQTLPVGVVTAGARPKISGRDVVKFLMASRVVAVWIHAWADVCLSDEQAAGGAYRLRVSGEHVYFTNQENHSPFDFEVTITAAGEIAVSRLPST